jgi:DNA-binding transcriptional LysR family regulator
VNSPSQLPPLNALRAFEAAARHLSFTRAASELAVTQTAISHQIKLLEAHLGVRLFQRLPRRLVLTRAGAAWAHDLHDVFARLHDANRRLCDQSRPDRPVLLHDDTPGGWRAWLKAHAVPGIQAEAGSVLVDSSMLVEAAVRGQGVALARLSLALDDLAAGRLIRAFPRLRPTPAPFAYYIVAPRNGLQRAVVATFRDWLRSEAGALVTEIGKHAVPTLMPGRRLRGD